jgi:hypothetical protein
VVNLATWLWLDPQVWHSFTATANAGKVTASAVAVPASVEWDTGDGSRSICYGPGVTFDATATGVQVTYCDHVFRFSSIAEHSADGNANDRAFEVTATVTWRVTWFAAGAAGGGVLPSLHTSATVPLRVEQVESVGIAS